MATGSVDFARELSRPVGPQHEDDEPVFGDADGPDPDGVAHESEFGENAVYKKISFFDSDIWHSVLMKLRNFDILLKKSSNNPGSLLKLKKLWSFFLLIENLQLFDSFAEFFD